MQAEGRQLPAAETNCRAALKASGGCHPPSWALLALVLSARQHIPAALAVAAAALEEAGPAYEGLLLKIKVGLQYRLQCSLQPSVTNQHDQARRLSSL